MRKYFITFCIIIFTHHISFAQVYFDDEQKSEIYRKNKVKKVTILFYEKESNSEDWKEKKEYNEIFEFNNFGYKTKDRTSQYKYLNDTILIEKITYLDDGKSCVSAFTYNGNCRKEIYTSLIGEKTIYYVYKDTLGRDSCYKRYDDIKCVSSVHFEYDSLGVLLESHNHSGQEFTIKRIDLPDGSKAFYTLYKYRNSYVEKTKEIFYRRGGEMKKKWTTEDIPFVHAVQEKISYFKYLGNGLIDEIIYVYIKDYKEILVRKHKFIYEFYN